MRLISLFTVCCFLLVIFTINASKTDEIEHHNDLNPRSSFLQPNQADTSLHYTRIPIHDNNIEKDCNYLSNRNGLIHYLNSIFKPLKPVILRYKKANISVGFILFTSCAYGAYISVRHKIYQNAKNSKNEVALSGLYYGLLTGIFAFYNKTNNPNSNSLRAEYHLFIAFISDIFKALFTDRKEGYFLQPDYRQYLYIDKTDPRFYSSPKFGAQQIANLPNYFILSSIPIALYFFNYPKGAFIATEHLCNAYNARDHIPLISILISLIHSILKARQKNALFAFSFTDLVAYASERSASNTSLLSNLNASNASPKLIQSVTLFNMTMSKFLPSEKLFSSVTLVSNLTFYADSLVAFLKGIHLGNSDTFNEESGKMKNTALSSYSVIIAKDISCKALRTEKVYAYIDGLFSDLKPTGSICNVNSSITIQEIQRIPGLLKTKMELAQKEIESIPLNETTFLNTVAALSFSESCLRTSFASIEIFASVHSNINIIQAVQQARESINNYFSSFGISDNISSILNSLDKLFLFNEDSKLHEFYRKWFLPPNASQIIADEIFRNMTKLENDYHKNLMNDATTINFTRGELVGLSDDQISKYDKAGEDLFNIKVDRLKFERISSYCKNSSTRLKMSIAYLGSYKRNRQLLLDAIKLRHQYATTLGFRDFSSYKLKDCMAKTSANAYEMLEKLNNTYRPIFDKEIEQLKALKRNETGNQDAILNFEDYKYYQTQYEIQKNNILNRGGLFPLSVVLTNLMKYYTLVYGITFEETKNDSSIWSSSVQLFKVSEVDKHSNISKVIGHFYLDLISRDNKVQGASCIYLCPRFLLADLSSFQIPVSVLLTNFETPNFNGITYLDHSQLIILLHEFGHLLHAFFSRATYSQYFANFLELDFTEAPSQMLENWAWDPKFLAYISDGIPNITSDTFAEISCLQHINECHRILYLLTIAHFDLDIHTTKNDSSIPLSEWNEEHLVSKWHDIFFKYYGYTQPRELFFPAMVKHLMNHYASLCYSYSWSRLMANNMFINVFKGEFFSPEKADLYRRAILEPDGTHPANDLVTKFMLKKHAIGGKMT